MLAMSTTTTAITHVQFDFDGTLVNTVDELVEDFREVARLHGKELTSAIIDYFYRQRLRHVPSQDAVPNISKQKNPFILMEQELGIKLGDPDNRCEYYRQFGERRKFKLLPGVERLVRHLHRHRIPMAVATGNYSVVYQTISKQFGDFFPTHFSHAVCGHDDPEIKANKPEPDVYLLCAKRFRNPPPVTDMSNVLIFEDSITGLTGAIKSGAKTVMIIGGKKFNDPEQQSIISKATLVVETLDDFRPEFFGLPPFSD